MTNSRLGVKESPVVVITGPSGCGKSTFLRGVSRWSPVAHYGFLMLVVINLVSGFHALGTLMAVGLILVYAGRS